jgi:hypothetical protein
MRRADVDLGVEEIRTVDSSDITKSVQEPQCGPAHAWIAVPAHLNCRPLHLGDPNSYGFRKGRAAADALEQCFKALHLQTSAQWVLEGDIKSCFDYAS